MAIYLDVSASFLTGSTLGKSFSVRFVPPVAVRANLRTVTLATVSKPASETKKREPRGFMKPRRVSREMQAFLGGISEIPRTQALKHIWAYIKQHKLQESGFVNEILDLVDGITSRR